MSSPPLSFETAVARLEQILEKMQSSSAALEESLALYEEAEQLLAFCTQRLQGAEQKVEMLIKKRNGELMLGADGKPIAQEFPWNEGK